MPCPPVTWLASTAMPAMTVEQNYPTQKLMPAGSETDTLIGGLWSNPASWKSGQLPGAGAKIAIAGAGIYDLPDSLGYKWIRVDSSLTVDNNADRVLNAELIVNAPLGVLNINFPDPAKHFLWNILDPGPIDAVVDPKLMGRGLLAVGLMLPDGTMGSTAVTNINGAPKTPFTPMQNAKAGDVQIIAASVTGWQVGDTLLFHGTFATTNSSLYQDDLRLIKAISGTTITLDSPLTYDHVAPAGLYCYAANLSRNIKIKSANVSGDPQRNGHVMFMHADTETLSYFELVNLGRTDKSKPLNNPVLDVNGALVAGTGTNTVGRYPLHTPHRAYNYDQSCVISVTGVVVNGSPGWGIVNHSGNVYWKSNIVYKAFGASYAFEAGDEIGTLDSNMSVHLIGVLKADSGLFDGGNGAHPVGPNNFGACGCGYWFQGSYGFRMRNNVSIESPQAGAFIYGFNGLGEPGFSSLAVGPNGHLLQGGGTQFPVWLLDPLTVANNLPANYLSPTVSVDKLGLLEFNGHTSIADTVSLFHSWMHTTDNNRAAIKNLTAWNCIMGINLGFVDHEDIVNPVLLGSDGINPLDLGGDGGMRNYGIKIVTGYGQSDQFYNPRIEHFGVGLQTPARGAIGIHGGHFNNATNLMIERAGERILTIDGDVTFGSYDRLNGRTQQNYFLVPLQTPPPQTFNLNTYLAPNTILLNTKENPSSELWYQQAAASYNPWNATYVNAKDLAMMPPELTSLTNGQAQAKFGRAFLGQSAPPDAVSMPLSNALISKAIPANPILTLSPYTTHVGSPDVTFGYSDPAGNQYTATAHLSHSGWNFVLIASPKFSFLIDYFAGPATVTLRGPLTVTAAQITAPVRIYYILDQGTTVESYQSVPVDMSQQPPQFRPDGTRFVVAEIKGVDAANYKYDQFFELPVTA